MQPDFTLKLISFIHHETSSEENDIVIDRISTDSEINDDYQEMMEMTEMLRTVRIRPKKETLENILAYSKKTAEEFH